MGARIPWGAARVQIYTHRGEGRDFLLNDGSLLVLAVADVGLRSGSRSAGTSPVGASTRAFATWRSQRPTAALAAFLSGFRPTNDASQPSPTLAFRSNMACRARRRWATRRDDAASRAAPIKHRGSPMAPGEGRAPARCRPWRQKSAACPCPRSERTCRHRKRSGRTEFLEQAIGQPSVLAAKERGP